MFLVLVRSPEDLQHYQQHITEHQYTEQSNLGEIAEALML